MSSNVATTVSNNDDAALPVYESCEVQSKAPSEIILEKDEGHVVSVDFEDDKPATTHANTPSSPDTRSEKEIEAAGITKIEQRYPPWPLVLIAIFLLNGFTIVRPYHSPA